MTGGVTAIVGAAAAVGGAAIKANSAKKAGKKQAKAAEAAAAEKKAALAQITPIQLPYQQAGTAGLEQLNKLNAGDYSGFSASPDYLFAQKQGGQAVDRSAAARGGLNSGNTLIAQQRFGQDLASQQLGAYRNSLFNQIGIGQHATDNTTSAILNTAGAVGNDIQAAGDARASGIVGAGNAWGSGLEQLGSIAGNYYGGGNSLIKKKPTSGPKINRYTYSPLGTG